MRTSPDEKLATGTHDNIHHPGEGPGPGGKARVTTGCLSSSSFPNWAPASAGVVADAETSA